MFPKWGYIRVMKIRNSEDTLSNSSREHVNTAESMGKGQCNVDNTCKMSPKVLYKNNTITVQINIRTITKIET